MQFNIDSDSGVIISGWLAPDNPNATPSFVVRTPGREDVRIASNVMREDIRNLGLHVTGQVGFVISTDTFSDLALLDDVTILDAESQTPIFRRVRSGRAIEKKMFLFDASLLPQRAMIEAFGSHFGLAYPNFEQHGLETAIVLLTAPFRESIFAGGRANYNRFSFWLGEKGYVRAALLRDPFEELAERLLFLSLIAKSDSRSLYPVYLTGVTPLVEFARGLPFDDSKGLKRAFREITLEQREALVSPMTRALGCEIGESPRDAHVSRALDNLATMDAVGVRNRFDLFKTLLDNALSADALGDAQPVNFPSTATLAATLRRLRVVEDLIAEDLRLFGLASEAIETGHSLRR